MIISRTGLGVNPVHLVAGQHRHVRPLRRSCHCESIALLAIGCFIYMGLVTFAEASEQTVTAERWCHSSGKAGRKQAAMAIRALLPRSALMIGPIRRILADSLYEFRRRTQPAGLAAGRGHHPGHRPGFPVGKPDPG